MQCCHLFEHGLGIDCKELDSHPSLNYAFIPLTSVQQYDFALETDR